MCPTAVCRRTPQGAGLGRAMGWLCKDEPPNVRGPICTSTGGTRTAFTWDASNVSQAWAECGRDGPGVGRWASTSTPPYQVLPCMPISVWCGPSYVRGLRVCQHVVANCGTGAIDQAAPPRLCYFTVHACLALFSLAGGGGLVVWCGWASVMWMRCWGKALLPQSRAWPPDDSPMPRDGASGRSACWVWIGPRLVVALRAVSCVDS